MDRTFLAHALIPAALAIGAMLTDAEPARADLHFIGAAVDGAGSVQGIAGASAVAVSRDGHHVYVAGAYYAGGIGIFARDTATGALSVAGAVRPDDPGIAGLHGARSLALSPDGLHLYVAGYADSAVAVLRRDAASGRLSFVAAYVEGVAAEALDGVNAVAVSPDGAHVYAVANRVDKAITAFRRDASTGALSEVAVRRDGVGGVDGLNGAVALAISPDGAHVYVASEADDNAVAVFRRDATSGGLDYVTALFDGRDGIDGLGGARGIAISSTGRHVYVAAMMDDSLTVFRRDAASGALSVVESERNQTWSWPQAVVLSGDGENVYVTSDLRDALVTFVRDRASGAVSFVAAARDGRDGVDGIGDPRGLVVTPDGAQVLVTGSADSAVAAFARDPDDGRPIFQAALFEGQGGIQGLNGAASVVVSPDAAFVYAGSREDVGPAIFRRDGLTGALDFVGIGPGGPAPVGGGQAIAISPDGAWFYAANESASTLSTYARDRTDGGLTPLQTVMDGVDGVDGLYGASHVAVSPDGRHIYVAGRFESKLAVFVRAGDGRLDLRQVVADDAGGVVGLSEPGPIAFSPDGAFVYVCGYSDDAVVTFRRDAASGALAFVAAVRSGVDGVSGFALPTALALSPDGAHLYVAGLTDRAVAAFRRDGASGRLAFVAALPLDALIQFYGLAASPDGLRLYAVGGAIDSLLLAFRRSAADGTLVLEQTLVDGRDGVDGLGLPFGVVASPDGTNVYVAAGGDDAVGQFRVRAADGATCSDDGGCESGFCADGVCCNLPCAAPNDACGLSGTGGVCVTRCVGDCDDDAQCRIDELVTVVNVALGAAGADACPVGDADGDGVVRVNEIVTAVNNALQGCRVDVAGEWQQDQVRLAASTCAAAITDSLATLIAAGALDCRYALTQDGGALSATESCPETQGLYTGSVDEHWQVTLGATVRETVERCTITTTYEITLAGNASRAPVTQVGTVRFAGSCPFRNCRVELAARWSRLPP